MLSDSIEASIVFSKEPDLKIRLKTDLEKCVGTEIWIQCFKKCVGIDILDSLQRLNSDFCACTPKHYTTEKKYIPVLRFL